MVTTQKHLAVNTIIGGIVFIGLYIFSGLLQAFDLQGHRGARGLMPENTLPAFKAALNIGVSTLEMDLGVTRDGHVVVMHNPRFEPEIARNSQGNWLQQSSPDIHSMNLQTVKSYDVGRLNPGKKYSQRFSDQKPVDGTSVPTLAEVFDLTQTQGNQTVRFNIEIKINPEKSKSTLPPKEFAQAVLKVIDQYNMHSRVTIQSFDWRALQAVKALAPEISTSYLTVHQRWLDNLQIDRAGASPWLAGFDVEYFDGSVVQAVHAAGATVWSPYHREVNAELIKQAHDLGLSVKVWTVNKPERMRELIAMGVDGIISDYPDRLRLVLQSQGIPVP